MISGLVAQILLFLLAAAIVGFLSGWFLGRQREGELMAELTKQRGLEERLAGRITQLLDGLGRPYGPGEPQALEAKAETTAVTLDFSTVRADLAGLKAVLEGLQGGQAEFAAKLSSLGNGLMTLQSTRTAADFRPLEHRLETLGSEVQRSLTPDFAWVKEDIGGVKRDVAELRTVVEGVKGEQLDVVSRLATAPVGPDLGPLQAHVQQLHDAVDALRKSLPVTGVELAALHTQLSELGASLDAPAPGLEVLAGDVAFVKKELGGLLQRVSELVTKAPPVIDLSSVERQVSELEIALMGRLEALGRLGALQGEVGAIRAEVEAVKDGQSVLGARLAVELERGGPEAAALMNRLEGLAGGVESLRVAVNGKTVDLSPLEERVERVAGSIESLQAAVDDSAAERAPLVAQVEALAGGVESLRGALNDSAADLSPLEERVEKVAGSIESLRQAVEKPKVDLSALDALAGKVESLRAVAERPTVDLSPLSARVEELAGSVESLRAAMARPAVDLSPLGAQVEGLAGNLESLRAAVGTPVTLDVSSLASGLDELQASVDSLRSAVDLAPLEGRVQVLGATVESLRGALEKPQLPVDLSSLEARVESLVEAAAKQPPVVDLSGLVGSVEALRRGLDAPAVVDLAPLEARVERLQASVESLRLTSGSASVDLAPLQTRFDGLVPAVKDEVAGLRASLADVRKLLEGMRAASPRDGLTAAAMVPLPTAPDPSGIIRREPPSPLVPSAPRAASRATKSTPPRGTTAKKAPRR